MSELQDIKLQIGKNQITKIEESKSSKIANEESTAYPRLPCFHDPAIQQTQFGMLLFKKGKYNVDVWGECVVEGEWLGGNPHGVCIYDGNHSRGVATFTRGKLHGGPYWYENKNTGKRRTYECMMHGEAVGLKREYHSDKNTSIVSDNKNKTPTPGWMWRVTEGCGKDIALGK